MGANEGEAGSGMERNRSVAVAIGTTLGIGAGAVHTAGTVGSSTAPAPAMSGHQQGVSEPPWCIAPGIMSCGQVAIPCSVTASGPPTSHNGNASTTRRRNARTRSRMLRIVYAVHGGWRNRGRPR